jgi:hypothetical protein
MTIRTAWILPTALAAACACIAAPASAGQAQQNRTTEQEAGRIVSQPARDVGVAKTKIPPLLVQVSEAPYTTRGAGTCRQIASSISALTGVLGPDFDADGTPKKRNLAKAGGEAVVNSLIPFRGLVREVSGAAPAERRLNAAFDAGFARRGFLRGLQRAKGCRG